MRDRCITYERFPERRWRQRPAPPPPRIAKGDSDRRQALARAVDAGKESYAALSVMLGRAPGYLRRFVHEGVPRALSEHDHGLLSDFFGQPLGHRDLWLHRP